MFPGHRCGVVTCGQPRRSATTLTASTLLPPLDTGVEDHMVSPSDPETSRLAEDCADSAVECTHQVVPRR